MSLRGGGSQRCKDLEEALKIVKEDNFKLANKLAHGKLYFNELIMEYHVRTPLPLLPNMLNLVL